MMKKSKVLFSALVAGLVILSANSAMAGTKADLRAVQPTAVYSGVVQVQSDFEGPDFVLEADNTDR